MRQKPTRPWTLRLILVGLVLTFVLTKPEIEEYGDSFQIALPVIGLACSVANGETASYLLRYLGQLAVVHGSKNLLDTTDINRRPRGGYQGMPSGHTATAVFGASYLARRCIGSNVWIKTLVILTAGYVGGSRVVVGAHDILQVLTGALIGWIWDRGFRRRPSPRARLRVRFGKRHGTK